VQNAHDRIASELIHSALDATQLMHHERLTGIVGETTSEELADALLRAGWIPPLPETAVVGAGREP
jgi:hypothetical protein